MKGLLNRLWAPPLTVPPTPTNTMEDKDEARAMETLMALSALLGPSLAAPAGALVSTVSTASPSLNNTTKGLLAKPMITCPPYMDPSSVLITDQGTLEFEIDTTCSSTSVESEPQYSKVRFREYVAIAEIPSHRDMDPEVVASLWSSTEEVQRNGRRNAAEYEHDGRDWTKVLEEADMVWDEVTQSYIHPATWEDMELERMHQEHMNRLVIQQQERREEYFRAEAAVKAVEVLRAEETANKEGKKDTTQKRRKKTERSPPRRKTSPKTSPRNSSRKKAPNVVQSASLTRFADT